MLNLTRKPVIFAWLSLSIGYTGVYLIASILLRPPEAEFIPAPVLSPDNHDVIINVLNADLPPTEFVKVEGIPACDLITGFEDTLTRKETVMLYSNVSTIAGHVSPATKLGFDFFSEKDLAKKLSLRE